MTTTTTADEREDLRAAIRSFLADRLDDAAVRRLIETDDGFDRRIWAQLAGELGLAGLLVPEEFGGQGASTVELGVVLEESGRALLGAPFLGSAILASTAVLQAGGRAGREAAPAPPWSTVPPSPSSHSTTILLLRWPRLLRATAGG